MTSKKRCFLRWLAKSGKEFMKWNHFLTSTIYFWLNRFAKSNNFKYTPNHIVDSFNYWPLFVYTSRWLWKRKNISMHTMFLIFDKCERLADPQNEQKDRTINRHWTQYIINACYYCVKAIHHLKWFIFSE